MWHSYNVTESCSSVASMVPQSISVLLERYTPPFSLPYKVPFDFYLNKYFFNDTFPFSVPSSLDIIINSSFFAHIIELKPSTHRFEKLFKMIFIILLESPFFDTKKIQFFLNKNDFENSFDSNELCVSVIHGIIG